MENTGKKTEKEIGKKTGLNILAGMLIASAAVEVLYRTAGIAGAARGLSYQVWVKKTEDINLTMVLPLLLLLLVWTALNRHKKQKKGWGMKLLAVGMAALYLFWLFIVMLVLVLNWHEEHRLVGDLLLANEARPFEENVWVYYRRKGIFFRVPGELEIGDMQRYLEEKYGYTFTVLEDRDSSGRVLFGEETHPDVAVKVERSRWELEDNYVEGLTVHYLKEGYRELGMVRPAQILDTGPYFYLELEDEADIAAFSEDAGRLIEYAVSRTPFFEEHRGILFFMLMEGEQKITGGLPFGRLGRYDSMEQGYWTNRESIAEYVAERYAQELEWAERMREYEAESSREYEARLPREEESRDSGALTWQDGATDRVYGEERSRQEEAAYRIYEEVLEEQGYSYEVCYDARGGLYIDLGQRDAGREGDPETEGFYRTTLVYDRLSANGVCELFVLYREHNWETETGTVQGNTDILEFYAVETESGRVIGAEKTGWAQTGCRAYREATGE